MKKLEHMRACLLAGIAPHTCFAVPGVFSSDSGIVGDPKGDFAAALLEQVPTGSAPFFALSSGMPSTPAADTIVHWFEEIHLAGRTTLAQNQIAGDLTIVVTDGSSFVAGTICIEEATGEYVMITAVAGNSLTVIRGLSGTTAAGMTNGDGFQRIGTAFPEGSGKPVAVANLGYPKFNYTQIFRNVWNVTGTAQAVQYYTGSKVAKNRRDASLLHAEDIERSMIWGKKTLGVVASEPFRTMDGLKNLLVTNLTVAGGTTNWTQFDAFLRGIFQVNVKGKPNERIAFCGNTVIAVINGIVRLNSNATTFIEPGQTEFGLKVMRWMTPYGDISLMSHPLMVENPLFTKDLIVLHPGAVETRWLRRTMEDAYDADGRRAGVDADFGVFTSELTFQYGLEATAGYMSGFTAAAAG